MLTSTRRGISYPNPDRSDRPDTPAHIGNVVAAVDVDVLYNHGTNAARLAAAHQASGGRYWWCTDTLLMWYDDGTTWHQMGGNIYDTLSNRPAYNVVGPGTVFFASDQFAAYVSSGSAWIRLPPNAGIGEMIFGSSADPGYILLQGQAWPSTTGIYADLYTRIGAAPFNANLPDLRGRVPVGYASGGKADVDNIGDNEGLAVALRNVKHHHTDYFATNNVNTGGGGTACATASPSTTSGDTDNVDTPAYLAVNWQIKL